MQKQTEQGNMLLHLTKVVINNICGSIDHRMVLEQVRVIIYLLMDLYVSR